MGIETKLQVLKKTSNSTTYLHLDHPKDKQSSNGALIRISGWAYAPRDEVVRIAIKRKNSIFITERNLHRSDVISHLEKKGEIVNKNSTHGFDFDFMSGDISIGFCFLGGEICWTHEIIQISQVVFEQANSFEHLLNLQEGTYKNFYFHNAKDWSKFIIFFNGALTRGKIKAEQAIFQRWSWAKKFKHPVLCIADPLTVGQNAVALAWYLGDKGRNLLPSILDQVIGEVRKINSESRFIGIGSSGGGFAAIGGTLLGRLDEAIAMNPQIDAMLFEGRSAVAAFMALRNGMPCDSDLKKYEFDQLKYNSRIIYLQNLHDEHHRDVHYKPFRQILEQSPYISHFRFIEYEDSVAGHAPPGIAQMEELIGSKFSDLLK